MGVLKRLPNPPWFVIVKVPSWTSSGGQPFLPRPFRQVRHCMRELIQSLLIGVTNDRNQKTFVQCHCDAYMDIFFDGDALLPPGRIQERQVLHGTGDGVNHKRQVGQRATISEPRNAGTVRFEKCRHVSGRAPAEDHAIRDGLSHLGDGNNLLLMRGRRRAGGSDLT